jgi:hypothetical protein
LAVAAAIVDMLDELDLGLSQVDGAKRKELQAAKRMLLDNRPG